MVKEAGSESGDAHADWHPRRLTASIDACAGDPAAARLRGKLPQQVGRDCSAARAHPAAHRSHAHGVHAGPRRRGRAAPSGVPHAAHA